MHNMESLGAEGGGGGGGYTLILKLACEYVALPSS